MRGGTSPITAASAAIPLCPPGGDHHSAHPGLQRTGLCLVGKNVEEGVVFLFIQLMLKAPQLKAILANHHFVAME